MSKRKSTEVGKDHLARDLNEIVVDVEEAASLGVFNISPVLLGLTRCRHYFKYISMDDCWRTGGVVVLTGNMQISTKTCKLSSLYF